MSDPGDREADIRIFNEALELPVGQRAAYLAKACEEHATLRERVEALLRLHGQAGDFFEKLERDAEPSSVVLTEKPGDRIGRYKLIEQIGEGGCGVVYLAEQEKSLHRRVALKVIKLGMDTKQVVARFEAERQALALMDHPNIAKVFDAGATDTGRPFFVMELARGIKITEYCDQNHLSTADRLKLFIQVCRAIQHAHQKGVIHRDIKPSNILVTTSDGVPVPKVIDFGIAKATQGRLTDQTLFTAVEQFIGTPAYMSPEQAELGGTDIDTRSDIYSLGVLLYELLTGRTPFDKEKLLTTGLDDVRRMIREKEPLRPSTRLRTLADNDAAAVAKCRGTEQSKLVHLVQGDLDWIVMKALEKDCTRRYETANGLARDVERYLDNEPVSARPPGNLYRFRKLVRRNKLAFAAAGAVLATLLLGLGISIWLFLRERQAHFQAEREAAESLQVTQFLEDMLRGAGPWVAMGRDTTLLREILDRAAKRVGADLKDQPEVQAKLFSVIGRVYQDLGQGPKAEAMYRQALAIQRRLLGVEDPAVADSLLQLATMLDLEGKRAEAEALCRQALVIYQDHFGDDNSKVAPALEHLAVVLNDEGKLAEAETLYRQVLAVRRKTPGDDFGVALALNNLGSNLQAQGHPAQAEALTREALATMKKARGNEHPDVAFVLNNLAAILQAEGKLAEAETAYRQALVMRTKLLNSDNPGILQTLAGLVSVLQDEGKLSGAEQLLDEWLTPATESKPPYSGLLSLRANLYARQGRFAKAAADLTQVIGVNPDDSETWHSLAAALVQSGQLGAYRVLCRKSLAYFGKTQDPAAAERVAKDCLILPSPGVDLNTVNDLAGRAVKLGANNPALGWFQMAKGLADYRQGRFASAVHLLQQVLAQSDPNRDVQAEAVLAMALNQLGQTNDARATLAAAELSAKTKLPRPGSSDLGNGWVDWIIARTLLHEARAEMGDH